MRPLSALAQRVRQVLSFRPHDTSTEHGRSRERYRRIILSTLAAFGARGIGLVASLISVPLTYRYLGAERYGLWMVLVSFIAAMGVADLGIGNGVMNAISEAHGKDDHELIRKYVTSGFALMLGISTLLAVAGLLAYPHIPWMRFFNVKSPEVAHEGAQAFLVLFGWFVVNIALDVILRIQSGLQRAYWSQTLIACGNLCSLFGIIVAIKLHGSLPWLVFASTFGVVASTMVNGVTLFRWAPWLIPSWRYFSPHAVRKILNLGVLFFVVQCSMVLGFTSQNIVIGQVLGASMVAVYAVPQRLFGFFAQLMNLGLAAIWPAYAEAISRGDYLWVRKAFWKTIQSTLLFAGILCPLLAITGPWIIRVAAGKTLEVPMSLMWVLAAWGIIASVWNPVYVLLNGAGSLKLQAPALAFASIVNLALSIYLARHFGVMGVCLAAIIAQVVIMGPVSVYLIRRIFKGMADGSIRQESPQPPDVLAVE
jgi:O-antigen/teichoic acid export membrane protein